MVSIVPRSGGIVKRRFSEVLTFGSGSIDTNLSGNLCSAVATIGDSDFIKDYTILIFPQAFSGGTTHRIDNNGSRIQLGNYGGAVAFIIESNTQIKAITGRSHGGFDVEIEFLEFNKSALVRPVEHEYEQQNTTNNSTNSIRTLTSTLTNTLTDVSKSKNYPCIGGGGYVLAYNATGLHEFHVPISPTTTTQMEWKSRQVNDSTPLQGFFMAWQMVEFNK